ncbi:LTA synthase family protein [Salinicola aestuarinus]|uniref:LTA synthase family protein n=1 Tax=Salinicola aestuarinus TaxID=1949082 RepID=UPI000DA13FA5|nr:LTA synthase family protein [Salinicola aestuarinus]
MTDLLMAIVATLAVTTLFETLLKPRPRLLWRRERPAIAVHLATTVLHFAFWLLIVQRPGFAVVIAASLQMVVIQVNNTKSASLREPFLCQDFEYFLDAVRHPRLYIPFFGVGLTIASLIAGAIAIGIGFWLEPSLFGREQGPWSLFVTFAIVASAVTTLALCLPRLPRCTLEPFTDLERFGLYPYLWAYGLMTRAPIDLSDNREAFPTPFTTPTALPHLVLVQSESFFDPREWLSSIRHDVLETFDAMMADSVQSGRLEVPAWGANTVRTESAVLTGLTAQALGAHRFNPYHQLSQLEVNNLARALKSLGYRTVCLHPYPGTFYLRDRVYPRLGFDEFIDIAAFDDKDRDGQYIGDLALARKVHEQLEATDAPLFVFVISMENHGPLHLETPDPAVAERWLEGGVTEGCEDLTVYLRHLGNTDSMLAALKTSLLASDRDGILAFYGDHVPIMPKVYARHGEPDGLTNYFIWQSHSLCGDNVRRTLSADKLGTTIYDRIIGRA